MLTKLIKKIKGEKMNYVAHQCKNKRCNNSWIDEDLTNAKSRPPQWKYCLECCEKLGYSNSIRPQLSKVKGEQLLKARSKVEQIALFAT